MFDKILIANRGEIALRVMRAAKELGIATVAVYSTADKDAMHVKLADESVCIGPPHARDSYLNIPAIVSACEITGADAVHPGYGFLAENAAFARAVEAAGLAFIGPTSDVIERLGDKASAKREAEAADVPTVPGSQTPSEDPAVVARIVREQLQPWHRHFVVEMGAYGPGSIARLCRLAPPSLALISPFPAESVSEVYVANLEAGTLQRASSAYDEAEVNGGMGLLSFAGDDRHLALGSGATNLFFGDGVDASEVYELEELPPSAQVVTTQIDRPPVLALPVPEWVLSATAAPQRDGSVILTASLSSMRGNKGIGLYGLSKAGVAQLARNLAVEWGPANVRVNSISPGVIATEFARPLTDNPEVLERRLSLTPLRRVGQPHEIAGVAVMLASAAGGFITGQNLIVDGGTLISDGN